MSRAHWIVRGHVQGVNFRYLTRQRASALGLDCKVWNRDDGAVECVAEGSAEGLDELERWLHRGPPQARVEAVERLEG